MDCVNGKDVGVVDVDGISQMIISMASYDKDRVSKNANDVIEWENRTLFT